MEEHQFREVTIGMKRTPRICIANRKYIDGESEESTDDEKPLVPIKKIKRVNSIDDVEENEKTSDDFIAIGRGIYKKLWKFPMTNICPKFKCAHMFSSRSIAMMHYREKHADDAILCEICVKPVGKSYLIGHFNKVHPQHPLPALTTEHLSDLNDDKSSKPVNQSPIQNITQSDQAQSTIRRPSVNKDDVVEIIINANDFSQLAVTVENNSVIIDATHKESNECIAIEKHLLYRCAVKYKFESADVTSNLSSDKMLSVLIPKADPRKVRQVPIQETGHASGYAT